jgi:hypothetical protein
LTTTTANVRFKHCVFADGVAICTCANKDIAMVIAYELHRENRYAQRARDDGRLFNDGKTLKGSRGIRTERF